MEFDIKGYHIIANEKTHVITVQHFSKGKFREVLAEGLPQYVDDALEKGDEYVIRKYAEDLIDRRL